MDDNDEHTHLCPTCGKPFWCDLPRKCCNYLAARGHPRKCFIDTDELISIDCSEVPESYGGH